MKRRDVLKLGAVAAGVGAGLPGCALPKLLGDLHGPEGGAAFNAMLDDQLGHLDRPGLLQRLVAGLTKTELSPEAHAKIAAHDAKFRELLGTLLITQGFRELPEDSQREQVVQDRMWSHMERIGATVFDLRDQLGALDPQQRASVQAVLKQQPELPMALGEALDERAARIGISRPRRGQLRAMMKQAAFRLRHGDPSTVIDECTGKVERMRASAPQDAVALELGRKLGEKAFWHQQRLASADDFGSGALAPEHATSRPPPPPSTTVAPGVMPIVDHPGSHGLRVGAYMLGIGFAVGLGSFVIASVSSGVAVVGATVAVLMTALGLIVLLISAAIYAAG